MQATGSHDRSLRLWERTEEPLFIEEEREQVSHTDLDQAVVTSKTQNRAKLHGMNCACPGYEILIKMKPKVE